MDTAIISQHSQIRLPSGETVLVDNEDLDIIGQFRWSLHRSGQNCYAIHSRKRTLTRPGFTLAMHRLVLGLGRTDRKTVVDHINGNGLDNRKANLRICSQQENLRNQRKRRHSKSKYKGVCPVVGSRSGKWAAKFWINGSLLHLGTFATQEDAARAYDVAASVHHGEFALLNFSKPQEVA